jgi:hypothetical protein
MYSIYYNLQRCILQNPPQTILHVHIPAKHTNLLSRKGPRSSPPWRPPKTAQWGPMPVSWANIKRVDRMALLLALIGFIDMQG